MDASKYLGTWQERCKFNSGIQYDYDYIHLFLFLDRTLSSVTHGMLITSQLQAHGNSRHDSSVSDIVSSVYTMCSL